MPRTGSQWSEHSSVSGGVGRRLPEDVAEHAGLRTSVESDMHGDVTETYRRDAIAIGKDDALTDDVVRADADRDSVRSRLDGITAVCTVEAIDGIAAVGGPRRWCAMRKRL